jgi:hypothetical protein
MRYVALLVAAFAFAGAWNVSAAAAGGRDGAVIVNSGSTNTAGYKIDVWSDGSASVTLQNRMGVAQSSPKPFTVTAALAKNFLGTLKAARDGHATGSPCMKSASFGSTTRVTWHGWTSPDLECPPDNALVAAIAHDAGLIRQASGIDTGPGRRQIGPPHLQNQTPPSPEPT